MGTVLSQKRRVKRKLQGMPKIFVRKVQEEEAPTNNTGGGNIAGLGVGAQGEPGVKKSKYKRDNETAMFRRPALEMKRGKFAGHSTFIVPNHIFEKARLHKRKGGHWKSYLDEDEYSYGIREWANKNPYKPIIFEDEKTGIMVFARYGGEQDRKRRLRPLAGP